MKIIKFILLVILVLVATNFIRNYTKVYNSNSLTTIGTGDYHFTIQDQGQERDYYVYVPKSYDPSKPTPVVFEFHGGGGGAKNARVQSQLDITAEEKGFVVVWPDSTGSKLNKTKNWNVGDREQKERQPGIDDIAFVEAVFKELKGRLNINDNKVFATGLSNGGMMSYNLACFSKIFKAIAPFGSVTVADTCPSGPIPVLAIHGTLDPLIPINGGPGTAYLFGTDIAPKDDFRSFTEDKDFWTAHNKCQATSQVYYQKGGATCLSYNGCAAATVYCTIENHGHTWPGGKYPLDTQFYRDTVGPISNDINGNEMMWKFFMDNSK